MSKTLKKIFIVASLILTSLFQGWPLLVAATCSMPEPQTMMHGGACCCCDNRQDSTTPAVSACTPGKTLAGVLVTDPSLLPVKDKIHLFSLSCFAIDFDFSHFDQIASSPTFAFFSHQKIFLHTVSPPVYLVDRAFRI